MEDVRVTSAYSEPAREAAARQEFFETRIAAIAVPFRIDREKHEMDISCGVGALDDSNIASCSWRPACTSAIRSAERSVDVRPLPGLVPHRALHSRCRASLMKQGVPSGNRQRGRHLTGIDRRPDGPLPAVPWSAFLCDTRRRSVQKTPERMLCIATKFFMTFRVLKSSDQRVSYVSGSSRLQEGWDGRSTQTVSRRNQTGEFIPGPVCRFFRPFSRDCC